MGIIIKEQDSVVRFKTSLSASVGWTLNCSDFYQYSPYIGL